MIMDNKVYNILKWICLTVVPALNVLIATLGSLYGWTWVSVAIGTIDAVAVFIGSIIGIGSYKYQKSLESEDQ